MKIKDRVLIVEDEQSISSFIAAVLEANGYDALTARTGSEAVSAITSHCPDVILLDLGLPGRDGLSICAAIRRESSIPIIFVTSRDSTVDELKALSMGGDDYITKPFNFPVLLARI